MCPHFEATYIGNKIHVCNKCNMRMMTGSPFFALSCPQNLVITEESISAVQLKINIFEKLAKNEWSCTK
mgnify:CR=1 FL=1